MDYDVANLCRICLAENKEMIHIFYAPSNQQISLHAQIILCCQIKLSPEDGLPQQICLTCHENIKAAYGLRELSFSSDATLRNYLSEARSGDQTSLAVPIEPQVVLPAAAPPSHTQDVAPFKTKKKGRKKNMSELATGTGCFSCVECNKRFIYKCQLRDHLVSHTGAKPYLCSVCGKSFSHYPTLSNHTKLHFGEKEHKCPMCTQSFHRKSHLTLHMRIHTGEKPFACKECGKEFAQATYLKEHARIHSGERPFVCESCGRGFARKSSLVMHQRVHTGELPYACPAACGRSFSQRSQRKRHVLRNHRGTVTFQENGELILREHDQLHALLNKNKTNIASEVALSTSENTEII